MRVLPSAAPDRRDRPPERDVAPGEDAPERAARTSERSVALRRALLAGLSALVAVSIWTVAPWLGLWVVSRLVSQTSLSMRGVVIVVAVLAAVVFALTLLLTWID